MPSPTPLGPDPITYACSATDPSSAFVDGGAGTAVALISPALNIITLAGAATKGEVPASSAPVAPTIDVQPSDLTVTEGQRAVLAVQASGSGPLSFSWKRGATPVGGNSAVLNLAAAQESDEGSYTVVVMNEAGGVTSNAATLTVVQGGTPAATEGQIWPVKL